MWTPLGKVKMLNSPVLSIITVSAFDEIRLARTMNSLARVPKNVEYLVVTPEKDLDSKKIWNKFQNDFNSNTKIVHDKNVGIFEAMNLGVSQASGDYVCFWNSGDELFSDNALDVLIETLQSKMPLWLICQGDFSWHKPLILDNSELKGFVLHEFGKFISHQTIVTKKDFFIDLGGFDTRFKVAADTAQITAMSRVAFPYFEMIKVVKVESPKFASRNHRRARLEVILIVWLYLKGAQRVKALYNILKSEVSSKFK